MEILGYISSIIMGLVLGVIGGGGSILTVPILVYLMGVAPDTATGYSLLLVGLTASYGAVRYFRQGLIDVPASIAFAAPSIVAVYLTRAFLMPAIPAEISIFGLVIMKNVAIMVVFALLMLVSATMMLKKAYAPEYAVNEESEVIHTRWILIMIEGALVGIVTGVLGAGGGFLIIPALVLFMGMSMHKEVGASLFIIALKSLIGFVGDLQAGIEIMLPMIPLMLVATFVGMFLSTHISSKLNGKALQKIFAFFTLIIAIVIISKELL